FWSNANNWVANTIADGAGATANFSTLPLAAAANPVINLDSSRTIGQLIFGETTSNANTWLLANNGIPANILTLDNTGGVGQPSIIVKNQTANISLVLAGTNGVVLNSATGASPTLVLSGANTYSGTTVINSNSAPSGNQFTIEVANSSAF